MRSIFINGRFLTQQVTGTQRYAHELLDSLDSILGGSSIDRPSVNVLVPPTLENLPNYKNLLVTPVGKYSGRLWEQLELPFYAWGGVLFTPCGGAPLLHPRNVITIHDAAVLAVPQGFSMAFRTWYQFLYWVLCRSSKHVFTVSNFSRAELVKWFGANPDKISVTYLGSEHAFRPEPSPDALEKNRLERFQYVLAVGSRNPNKNLAGLLKAVPYLVDSGVEVAVAGGGNSKIFGEANITDKRVRDLGYVSDSELRTFYENAACFVFPSFYEGFGLPPLEALALGCPAVVSKTSSLTEIFEKIAFICDPNDPSDIADKISQACNASQEARFQNRQFAGSFRWEECAKMTWKVIAQLAES